MKKHLALTALVLISLGSCVKEDDTQPDIYNGYPTAEELTTNDFSPTHVDVYVYPSNTDYTITTYDHYDFLFNSVNEPIIVSVVDLMSMLPLSHSIEDGYEVKDMTSIEDVYFPDNSPFTSVSFASEPMNNWSFDGYYAQYMSDSEIYNYFTNDLGTFELVYDNNTWTGYIKFTKSINAPSKFATNIPIDFTLKNCDTFTQQVFLSVGY